MNPILAKPIGVLIEAVEVACMLLLDVERN